MLVVILLHIVMCSELFGIPDGEWIFVISCDGGSSESFMLKLNVEGSNVTGKYIGSFEADVSGYHRLTGYKGRHSEIRLQGPLGDKERVTMWLNGFFLFSFFHGTCEINDDSTREMCVFGASSESLEEAREKLQKESRRAEGRAKIARRKKEQEAAGFITENRGVYVTICNKGNANLAVTNLIWPAGSFGTTWRLDSWILVGPGDCKGVSGIMGYNNLVFALVGKDNRLGVVRYSFDKTDGVVDREVKSICVSDSLVVKSGDGKPNQFVEPCPDESYPAPISATVYLHRGPFSSNTSKVILSVSPKRSDNVLFTVHEGQIRQWVP